MVAISVADSSEPGSRSGAPADRSRADGEPDESIYLMGRPPIKHVLRFARNQAVSPPPEHALIDAWNAAHAVLREVELEEAGSADAPPMKKLGPEYEPLLRTLLKDPLIRNGFNAVPTDIVLIELDRLVVYQKHIDITFARRLENRLGSAPSDEEVFQTCLPFEHPLPPVKWAAAGGKKFVFVSPSNDLRFLGSMSLQAGHIKDYPPPGVIAGVVGLSVGFGSNFMNAIYAEKRLILNNGSHRAYALRRLGVTHVPCIVQHVRSRHELKLVGPSAVVRDPELFLKRPRPPMLKDYFNSNLHIVLAVHRCLRQVTVRFDVEEHYVPAL